MMTNENVFLMCISGCVWFFLCIPHVTGTKVWLSTKTVVGFKVPIPKLIYPKNTFFTNVRLISDAQIKIVIKPNKYKVEEH